MRQIASSVSTEDTIIALATPAGTSAIAVLRVSGKKSIGVTNQLFPKKDLNKVKSHTAHYGTIQHNKQIIDEVVITIFKGPASYTGENSVEISCHGSMFIVKSIIETYQDLGVRYAKPGEFTKRAFMNGKLDLAQAEAVADLIASDNASTHKTAVNQIRGGFSNEIKGLREELINFASLVELELDFGEEDVEFADREDLKKLVTKIKDTISSLLKSFTLGNVIKNGIATVIAGKPNAGKSTLLNTLLKEEKAIVSDIPGTTRDFIEDELNIEGISFRFIDTAGLRETKDKIEAIGVQRTYEKMKKASLIIYMTDISSISIDDFNKDISLLKELAIPFVVLANKIDLLPEQKIPANFVNIFPDTIGIVASNHDYADILKQKLLETIQLDNMQQDGTIVTNVRHYESLKNTLSSLVDVEKAIEDGISGDFLAIDIRQSLYHLGEITGEVTTDDLLANIFSKFCIGK